MSNASRSIVLATSNAGKIRELRRLLAGVPVEWKSLRDFNLVQNIAETGSTFEENAVLKARGIAIQTAHLSLADDSGLEVLALGNEPGVRSARFGGEDAGYDIKMRKLLQMVDAKGIADRSARFVCVMALSDENGQMLHIARGECRGSLSSMPRGGHGFGYDPIFQPDGYDLTFGELGDEVKQRISHRARAAELIIRFLLDFTGHLT